MSKKVIIPSLVKGASETVAGVVKLSDDPSADENSTLRARTIKKLVGEIKQYRTVADMQADSANLKAGQVCQTLCYAYLGDNAGDKYLLSDSNDGGTSILVGSLYANKYYDATNLSKANVLGVIFKDNIYTASFDAIRYGLASGKSYKTTTSGVTNTIVSDFSSLMIYKEIRRCIVDKEDNIVAWFGDANYDDTLTLNGYAPHTHRVMVYIPKFYYKFDVSYVPYIMDIAISKTQFAGSKVHEAFLQHGTDGILVERDYILVSAYEGVAVNRTTGAYLFTSRAESTTRVASDFQVGTPSGLTDYTNYLLTSVNKVGAQAPVTNGTLANMRTMAQNWNTSKTSKKATTQMQFWVWHMLNVLFMVEFANTDWQGTLSAGVTNLSTGTYNEAVSTGYTSALGNSSGYITGIVRGDLGTTQVPSYRGIENPFGNIWKFCEGIKKLASGVTVNYGKYNILATNDYSVYANTDFVDPTTVSIPTAASAYYKYRGSELLADYNTTTGTNYLMDYQWYGTAGQIMLAGGDWGISVLAGGFAVTLNNAASAASRFIGARVIS